MSATGPCPICDGRRLRPTRVHTSDGLEYTLLECQDCDLQHWQPLTAPRAAYYEDEGQAMYAAMHQGTRRAEDDPRFARFLAEFGGRSGQTLLDVGCADGALMAAFRARGNDVRGIDIDTRSLEAARARGLEVREATLDTVGTAFERPRTFDFVTMFDVLEHLTNPRRALEVARDLLAPGGHLVGTVPNRERLFANLVDADFPPHHFLRFDRAALEHMLARAGMKTDRVEVFQWGYAGTVLLNAALRRLKRSIGRGRAPSRRGGTAGASTRPATGRSWKQRTAGLMNATAAGALRPVEERLGRGFKLYFVAQRTG